MEWVGRFPPWRMHRIKPPSAKISCGLDKVVGRRDLTTFATTTQPFATSAKPFATLKATPAGIPLLERW